MPIMLRHAWHDAGTFCKNSNTGGPNGTIRYEQEIQHGCNNGLCFTDGKIAEIKQNFPDVSYSDISQIGGYAAVEFCQGP